MATPVGKAQLVTRSGRRQEDGVSQSAAPASRMEIDAQVRRLASGAALPRVDVLLGSQFNASMSQMIGGFVPSLFRLRASY